jgi:hypothetical protein
MLQKFISDLCDKYSHFGEYLIQELIDAGKFRYGKPLRVNCSQAMLSQVYAGTRGLGPVASEAFGRYLEVPADHYEKLYRLFIAEKKRRAAKQIEL